MEKALADAFLDFYHNMLKPEFDAIKGKQAEHDQRFDEILSRLELEDAAWKRRQSRLS